MELSALVCVEGDQSRIFDEGGGAGGTENGRVDRWKGRAGLCQLQEMRDGVRHEGVRQVHDRQVLLKSVPEGPLEGRTQDRLQAAAAAAAAAVIERTGVEPPLDII